MHIISVTKTSAIVVEKDKLTSGSVGIPIEFIFDDDVWGDLTKIVNFKNVEEEKGYDITLIGSTTTYIPAEVLRKPYEKVLISISGLDDVGNVVNTVYANLGYVEKGSTSSDTSGVITPSVESQLLIKLKELYDAFFNGEFILETALVSFFLGPDGHLYMKKSSKLEVEFSLDERGHLIYGS